MVMWEDTSVAKRPQEELGRRLELGRNYWSFYGTSNEWMGRVSKF